MFVEEDIFDRLCHSLECVYANSWHDDAAFLYDLEAVKGKRRKKYKHQNAWAD